MFNRNATRNFIQWSAASCLFLGLTLVGSAQAQRTVPVIVDNDRSQPIPVEFVKTGGVNGGQVQSVLCIEGINGPGVGNAFPGCMEISGVGFSLGRTPEEPGEKGGTQDINIGVADISPVTVMKPVDGVSADLFIFGVNGNSMGEAEIHVLEQREGWSGPLTTLEIHLGRVFARSIRVDDGGLTETVGFSFNELGLKTYGRDASGNVVSSSDRCWDTVKRLPCTN